MNIGARLRELRKSRQLTLVELSKKSGVALATLSRIETGKRPGTLKVHFMIAKAFDMSLPEFYSAMEKPLPTEKREGYTDFFVHNDAASSVILTKNIVSKRMLPVLIKLSSKGKTPQEQQHPGSEKFLYVLKGRVEAVVGKEKHILKKGATLYFDASQPHYITNKTNKEVRLICILTPTSL